MAEDAEPIAGGLEAQGGFERVHPDTLRFSLFHATATEVWLAGSWDDWRTHPMRRGADRAWVARLAVAPGRHVYRYTIDGFPSTDPANQAMDVAADGGLVSVLDTASPVPLTAASSATTADASASIAPSLGPLRLGVRYRGVSLQDVEGTEALPIEGLHTLDLPVAAKLRGYGRTDLLFGSRASGDTETADVRLLHVRAAVRLDRARVRLFRNFPALPSGAAPPPLVASIGRFGHPLGLESQGASGRLRFGDLRATVLQLVGEEGLLGPAARLGAAGVSGPIAGLRLSWSGARESDRETRFVAGDEIWDARPVEVDSLREDRSSCNGWRLALSMPAPEEDGPLGAISYTRGESRWSEEAWWIGERRSEAGAEESFAISDNQSWSVALGWVWSRERRSSLPRWARVDWDREEIDPAPDARRSADRLRGRVGWIGSRLSLVAGASHRRTTGVDRRNDPLLTDWVWRGMAEGVGRASWWELPLLGLPGRSELTLSLEYPSTEAGAQVIDLAAAGARFPTPVSSKQLPWVARLESAASFDGMRAPLLTTTRCIVERAIGDQFFARADLWLVTRDQPALALSSRTIAPYGEFGYRPGGGLLLTLGLGVDPIADDPLTREPLDRGREDFLVGRADYYDLVELDDAPFARSLRSAEHALAGRIRVGLELVYRFGEPRPRILGGSR